MKKQTLYFALAVLAFFTISSEARAEYQRVFTETWYGGLAYSSPTATDLDGDGLIDLLVGEDNGNINHYEQNLSGSTEFSLVSDSFNAIDVGNDSTPVATDLDGDGLIDLLVGESSGNINYYEQNSSGSTEFSLVSESFNAIDVGVSSTPVATDLDGDGLIDLLVGESFGNINHYEQNSSGSTEFSLVSDSFNAIDVGVLSTPVATDLDGDGLIDLLVGESSGNINHYEQNSSGSTEFTLVSDSFNAIDIGSGSTPVATDLDGDGLIDLLVGESLGNINHYEQSSSVPTEFSLISESFNSFNAIDVGSDSTPVATDLDGDGLIDLLVGESSGNINHYEQNSSGSTEFSLVSDSFNDIDVGSVSIPVTTDLDGDGLIDLLIGESGGNIHHYEQNLSGSTEFTLVSDSFSAITSAGGDSNAPAITDLDGDGLIDLLVGDALSSSITHYKQDAADPTLFTLVSQSFNDISISDPLPTASDLDGDGLVDLLVGGLSAGLQHYEQSSLNSLSFTLVTESFENMTDDGLFVTAADVDEDGGTDIFVGNSDGGILLYLKVVCGDSVVEGEETCDDSNTTSGDGCSASCQSEWYADTDGDGYGDALSSQLAAEQPSGYVTSSTDCDDTNPAVNPNATETCQDGTDQDCDGTDAACADASDTEDTGSDTSDTDGDTDQTGADTGETDAGTSATSSTSSSGASGGGGCAIGAAQATQNPYALLLTLMLGLGGLALPRLRKQ